MTRLKDWRQFENISLLLRDAFSIPAQQLAVCRRSQVVWSGNQSWQ